MIAAQPIPIVASVASRQIRMLRTAMGAAIAAALEDPDVVEVLLNPDGTLWVDRLSTGRAPTGLTLSREDGVRHYPPRRRPRSGRGQQGLSDRLSRAA